MSRNKIYVPVDPADVFQVPSAPRHAPAYLIERSHRGDRRALTLMSAAAGGALGGAFMGGWFAVAALPVCLALALGGFWQRRSARWLVRVVRDGLPLKAKVAIDLGRGPTEVRYVHDEKDVSGDMAVFAGDPTSAQVSLDYEYGGRIWSVSMRVVGEGKPAPVKLAGKVGCAVLVLDDQPGRPLLVTQKMAKAVSSR
jgi:hypothetical protein